MAHDASAAEADASTYDASGDLEDLMATVDVLALVVGLTGTLYPEAEEIRELASHPAEMRRSISERLRLRGRARSSIREAFRSSWRPVPF